APPYTKGRAGGGRVIPCTGHYQVDAAVAIDVAEADAQVIGVVVAVVGDREELWNVPPGDLLPHLSICPSRPATEPYVFMRHAIQQEGLNHVRQAVTVDIEQANAQVDAVSPCVRMDELDGRLPSGGPGIVPSGDMIVEEDAHLGGGGGGAPP